MNRAGVCAAALALVAAQLAGCGDDAVGTTASDGVDVGEQTRLRGFASDTALLEQFRRAARAESSAPPAPPVAAIDAGGWASPAPELSGTNVQVHGVDEADTLKTDGRHAYVLHTREPGGDDDSLLLSPSTLQRYTLAGPAVLQEAQALPVVTHWNGLYRTDTRLLLQGEGALPVDAGHSSHWWDGSEFRLRALALGAAGELGAIDWELRIDGRLVGSRRIGDTLYLVTEYGAPYIHPASGEAGNIDALSLADWLPSWHLNGADRGPLVGAGQCYRALVDARRESTRVTAVVALPLDDPEALRARCLLGTAETVFVSREALYLATTADYYASAGFADMVFPSASHTDVHKFALDASLGYRGGVRLAGHLGWHPQRRSYRLGERDGVLSVVTSGGSQWAEAGRDHRLYILGERDGQLALRGELPNARRPAAIGKPGERVYGTRAVGDRVYVVTFQTVDPLYVIDVADPDDPAILGELEVPGFSDYLHPVGGDRLLGVGKAAVAAGVQDGDWARGGWYQGLRFSLFDVSDPTRPSLINALEYGDRGSETDLFADFHALAWLSRGEGAEFALPVNLHRHASAPEEPWETGDFVHRGLYRFRVDQTGLREQAQALRPGAAHGYGGRAVLAEDGRAWFFDGGELYYIDPANPSLLQASRGAAD